MTCLQCGGSLRSRRENHNYTESGLKHVVLMNVEVRHCPDCGTREVVIPRLDQLHRVIAQAVSTKPKRLVPQEIRFLRKCLGWSGVDFAGYMGVTPETVSRWENGSQDMGPVADRLLRMFVANAKPATTYPVELFRTPGRHAASPLRFKADPEWKQAA